MNAIYLPLVSIIILSSSCANNTETNKKESGNLHNQSFETNGLDTINLVDQNGLKQGLWQPSPTNKLKDAVTYRNDTII